MIVFIAICGAVALGKGSRDSKKSIFFWLAACVIPVFLMLRVSLPVWEAAPFLFHAIQYPWRLNIVLCIAALPIVAAFLSGLRWTLRVSQVWPFVLVLLVVVTWVVSYERVWKRYKTETVPPRQLVNDDDGWFEAWSAPGLDQARARDASDRPSVRFPVAEGAVNLLTWKPRHIEFQTDSPAGGVVLINQFYYPLWRAALNGDSHLMEVEAAVPEGLIKLRVPAGRQRVLLEIPTSAAEYIGRWLSALSILLWAFWGWPKMLEPGGVLLNRPISTSNDRVDDLHGPGFRLSSRHVNGKEDCGCPAGIQG
jgi:hypothetical protein